LALLKESVKEWAEQVRAGRCPKGKVSTRPGSCGDIQFYVIEVKFDALKDEEERLYFMRLPPHSSCCLKSGQTPRCGPSYTCKIPGIPEAVKGLKGVEVLISPNLTIKKGERYGRKNDKLDELSNQLDENILAVKGTLELMDTSVTRTICTSSCLRQLRGWI